MSRNDSSCRISLRSETKVLVQICTVIKREISAAFHDTQRYCDQQLAKRIRTLTEELINNVKKNLDGSVFGIQESVNRSVREKFGSLKQQISSCTEEQTSVTKLQLENLKGENMRLQERVTLWEAQNSARRGQVASMTAFWSYVGSVKLNVYTRPCIEATMNHYVTSALSTDIGAPSPVHMSTAATTNGTDLFQITSNCSIPQDLAAFLAAAFNLSGEDAFQNSVSAPINSEAAAPSSSACCLLLCSPEDSPRT